MSAEVVPVTPDETRGVDLDAIAARADAATPGPWEWTHGMDARAAVLARTDPSFDVRLSGYADAEFIAHARTDIPALVAEVRVLRDQRNAAVSIHYPLPGHPGADFCHGCEYMWPCPTFAALSGKDTE